MLFSSSKRAFNSTSTATCLPFSAASIRAFHHRGIDPHAIERLLDGQHQRIVGGSRDKVHDGSKAIIRMMQRDIVVANRGENIMPLAQLRRRMRHKRRIFQIGPFNSIQFHQIAMPSGPSMTVKCSYVISRLSSSRLRMRGGMDGLIARSTTEPKRRSRSPFSTSSMIRSPASSSC